MIKENLLRKITEGPAIGPATAAASAPGGAVRSPRRREPGRKLAEVARPTVTCGTTGLSER